MAKKIEWNKRALRKIREITFYLQTEVSDKAANNFVDAVNVLPYKRFYIAYS